MRLALLLTLAARLSAVEIDYKDPRMWLTYAKDVAGQCYSELNQINATNVHRLMAKWIYQTGVNGKFEATPLVFDGMMYVTAPSNHAFGIDLETGTPIWHYFKKLPPGVSICCGQVNRGFAARDGKLFKLNLEMALLALDAKTGSVVWETGEVFDALLQESQREGIERLTRLPGQPGRQKIQWFFSGPSE